MTPAALSAVIGHQDARVPCKTAVALRLQPKQHTGWGTALGTVRCEFADGVSDGFDWKGLEIGGQPVESRYVEIVVSLVIRWWVHCLC